MKHNLGKAEPVEPYSIVFIFSRESNPISKAIRHVSHGQYSHVAMRMKSPTTDRTYEARETKGVITGDWDGYDLPEKHTALKLTLSKQVFRRVEKELLSHVGKPYDYWGVATHVLPLPVFMYPEDWQKGFYCSEYAMLPFVVIYDITPHPFPDPQAMYDRLGSFILGDKKGFMMQSNKIETMSDDSAVNQQLVDAIGGQTTLNPEELTRDVLDFRQGVFDLTKADGTDETARGLDLSKLKHQAQEILKKAPKIVAVLLFDNVIAQHLSEETVAELRAEFGELLGGGTETPAEGMAAVAGKLDEASDAAATMGDSAEATTEAVAELGEALDTPEMAAAVDGEAPAIPDLSGDSGNVATDATDPAADTEQAEKVSEAEPITEATLADHQAAMGESSVEQQKAALDAAQAAPESGTDGTEKADNS